MKLKVRTLKNVEVEVDVSPEATLLELKQQIEAALPHMEATKQMLIHQGKILNDAMKVSEYPSIKENDKLVVMVPKQKQSVTTPSQSAGDSKASAPSEPRDQPAGPQEPAGTDPSAAVPVGDSKASGVAGSSAVSLAEHNVLCDTAGASGSATNSVPVSHESTATVDSAFDAMVDNICAMGFEKEQVQAALQAAYDNPDRAVEYLMTGIPPSVIPPSSAVPLDSSAGESVGDAAGETSGLAILRQHPLFEQIRAAIQSNPQILPEMLQMIQLQSPELSELIANNQMEFLQMLAEGSDYTPSPAGPGASPVAIHVTPEQQEIVRRLVEGLGFPAAAVLQALLVCEWNEDRAANFLFDNAGDFEEEDDEDQTSQQTSH